MTISILLFSSLSTILSLFMLLYYCCAHSVGGSFIFILIFWVKRPWILVVRMNGWTSTNICIWRLVLLESRESRVSHMEVNSKQRSGHQIQGFTPVVLSPVEPAQPRKFGLYLAMWLQSLFNLIFFFKSMCNLIN